MTPVIQNVIVQVNNINATKVHINPPVFDATVFNMANGNILTSSDLPNISENGIGNSFQKRKYDCTLKESMLEYHNVENVPPSMYKNSYNDVKRYHAFKKHFTNTGLPTNRTFILNYIKDLTETNSLTNYVIKNGFGKREKGKKLEYF